MAWDEITRRIELTVRDMSKAERRDYLYKKGWICPFGHGKAETWFYPNPHVRSFYSLAAAIRTQLREDFGYETDAQVFIRDNVPLIPEWKRQENKQYFQRLADKSSQRRK